ncbi:MAG TPA: hypothetical protein VIS72_10310 [Anaerolineales bacterium]
MDIQTFLDNLKKFADRFSETSQIPTEFYDFFKNNYQAYVSATDEEREKVREFIKPPRKSFWKGLVRSKKGTNEVSNLQISNSLLTFVKDKALPQLKSTKDTKWLYKGLVAIARMISRESSTMRFIQVMQHFCWQIYLLQQKMLASPQNLYLLKCLKYRVIKPMNNPRRKRAGILSAKIKVLPSFWLRRKAAGY